MSRPGTYVIGLTLLVGLVVGNPGCPRSYRPLTLDYRLNPVAVIGDSYTTGTDEGGLGSKSWTACTWQMLAARGVRIAADVAAEGRAGYGVPGDHGNVFEDLTARAVQPDDALVVFFGSRNDQGMDPEDPEMLAEKVRDTFDLARHRAPSASLLVIAPPWPTADVPGPMLRIRDVLGAQARAAGAVFVDPIADHWFVDRPELIGADGVHPNDAGHEYLADKIAPLISMELVG